VSIQLPRDTKGWGGHGNYIVLGGRDVSDVCRAVEISLELTQRNAGEVYINEAGHLEFAYSASAGEALAAAFGATIGQAFGFMAGSPAAIGLLMADKALKSAGVTLTRFMTPDRGTAHSNEVIIAFTGDASAVKTAVLTGREIGLSLLSSMGEYPGGPSVPYLC
jgi:ethanolamine utilization microcompartment shell protein EutL